MLIFDEANLTKVARIVMKFNRAAPSDINVLVSNMRAHAFDCLRNGPSYVAIGGYMLTSYVPAHDPLNVHVKASVADHCFADEDIDPAQAKLASKRKARAYYTLLQHHSDDGYDGWCIEFGDYDRAVVQQELEDVSRSQLVPRKRFKIIKSGDGSKAIDAAVARVNAAWRA